MSNESALARSTVLAPPSVVGVEPRRWCSGSVSRFRWVCWSTVSNCPARPIYQPCWGVHGHAARGVGQSAPAGFDRDQKGRNGEVSFDRRRAPPRPHSNGVWQLSR